MLPALEPAEMPADAIEVGRIADAWGIKGWFKIIPYSASAEALFSARRWWLLPPERGARHFEGAQRLRIRETREHSDGLVACAEDLPDRNAAEQLKGARIFVPRTSFPTPAADEYYWVDLIGLQVINREGVALGQVQDLLATGPQSVLVLHQEVGGQTHERLIPFVSAFVDEVDLAAGVIKVDWQPDY